MATMDLFSYSAEKRQLNQPLAERMRPQQLSDVVGQGVAKALWEAGTTLPSIILWGPPGTGKTTLARILAKQRRCVFVRLSAVTAGVKDIRQICEQAENARNQYGTATILFLDEIHRFSRSQQDSLLHAVETGVFTLVGATTENPSFALTSALLSRCKVVVLSALTNEELIGLARRALADSESGLGKVDIVVKDTTLQLLAEMCSGDARRMLCTLDLAVGLAAGQGDGELHTQHIERALEGPVLNYDRNGEEHYSVVSAFIKSLRGSDPDAAVYWLVRMLEAGEDPKFLLRRMAIFASEDIGNADPNALNVTAAAERNFHFIGLPEGVLTLCQTAIYLATAPKSNTVLTAYAAARKLVKERGSLPVPMHLRNAVTELTKKLGYGDEYKYPHDFAGHYVKEKYLPEELADVPIVKLSDQGFEARIQKRMAER